MIRRIAHLDMDAFYASVELLRYPQLKGLPVVIGGGKSAADLARLEKYAGRLHEVPIDEFPLLKSYQGRGVITTATYAARDFGIGSAMGMMKAAKLCPDAILLPVTFDEYRRVSRAFKNAVLAIAPQMQDRGIDEIYLDLTQLDGAQEEGGAQLAKKLQEAVFAATGLTCSIGVAPNKLLAKMASEFNKPNGISIVMQEDIEHLIWPLPVRKINGIGPKAEEKLKTHGIETIAQLASFGEQELMEHFGKNYGAWLHRAAHGIDDSPVENDSEPVSMSRETTFERDMLVRRDRQSLSKIFTTLCEQVAEDLRRKGYAGKTIGIKIKYDNFKTATRDSSIDHYTADAKEIRYIAGLCLKRLDLSRAFRLLGVRVAGLIPAAHAATAIVPQKNGKKANAMQDLQQVLF